MKFLFIFSLLGVVFQSVGERFDRDLSVERMLSKYASDVANCDVDELNISSLSDVKNICQSLVSSKVCSGVEPEYRMDCDNLVLEDNEYKFGFSKESVEDSMRVFDQACEVGAEEQQEMTSEAFKSMAILMGALIVRGSAVEVLSGEFEWTTESIDNAKSTWTSVVAEADRLETEEQVDPRASLVRAAFVDPKINEYEAYGCLNRKGRKKKMCESMAEGFGAFGTVGAKLLNTGLRGTLSESAMEPIKRSSNLQLQRVSEQNTSVSPQGRMRLVNRAQRDLDEAKRELQNKTDKLKTAQAELKDAELRLKRGIEREKDAQQELDAFDSTSQISTDELKITQAKLAEARSTHQTALTKEQDYKAQNRSKEEIGEATTEARDAQYEVELLVRQERQDKIWVLRDQETTQPYIDNLRQAQAEVKEARRLVREANKNIRQLETEVRTAKRQVQVADNKLQKEQEGVDGDTHPLQLVQDKVDVTQEASSSP